MIVLDHCGGPLGIRSPVEPPHGFATFKAT